MYHTGVITGLKQAETVLLEVIRQVEKCTQNKETLEALKIVKDLTQEYIKMIQHDHILELSKLPKEIIDELRKDTLNISSLLSQNPQARSDLDK